MADRETAIDDKLRDIKSRWGSGVRSVFVTPRLSIWMCVLHHLFWVLMVRNMCCFGLTLFCFLWQGGQVEETTKCVAWRYGPVSAQQPFSKSLMLHGRDQFQWLYNLHADKIAPTLYLTSVLPSQCTHSILAQFCLQLCCP